MSTSILQEKPKRRMEVFFAGIALFSMFFGAGNLIFPLLIGKAAGIQVLPATLGFMISGVIFPFLGLMAMMVFQGDLHKFLGRLGQWPAFFLLFALQITQGPLCISRLFILMHATLKAYLPWVTLPIASVLIAILSFCLCFRPQRVIGLLGAFLTPLLILSLGVLIIFGIFLAPLPPIVPERTSFYFMEGLKGGYLTMDLISALLFATMIIPHIAKGTETMPSKEATRWVRRKVVGASLIAASLLALSYVGLCWISAHHCKSLPENLPSEDLLRTIAVTVLGPWGGGIAAAAVFLACLTTALSLAVVFSDYLRKDLLRNRISPINSLIITLGAAAALANLGFSGILSVMKPILEILYPALIVLCFLNIAHSFYKIKMVKTPIFFTLAAGGWLYLIH